jgi:hypothetical protein
MELRVVVKAEPSGVVARRAQAAFIPEASPNCCARSMSGLRLDICAVMSTPLVPASPDLPLSAEHFPASAAACPPAEPM